jgi:hypothetical protein
MYNNVIGCKHLNEDKIDIFKEKKISVDSLVDSLWSSIRRTI